MDEVWIWEYDAGDDDSTGSQLLHWMYFETADRAKAAAQDHADKHSEVILEWRVVDAGAAMWWETSNESYSDERYFVARLVAS